MRWEPRDVCEVHILGENPSVYDPRLLIILRVVLKKSKLYATSPSVATQASATDGLLSERAEASTTQGARLEASE